LGGKAIEKKKPKKNKKKLVGKRGGTCGVVVPGRFLRPKGQRITLTKASKLGVEQWAAVVESRAGQSPAVRGEEPGFGRSVKN